MTVQSAAQLAFDGSSVDGSLHHRHRLRPRHPMAQHPDRAVDQRRPGGVRGAHADGLVECPPSRCPVDGPGSGRAGRRGGCLRCRRGGQNWLRRCRPCYSLHAYLVDACPARTDYAFPSGHSTTAFAAVAALWLLDRRLSAIAAVFAVLEGFTRVYVGRPLPTTSSAPLSSPCPSPTWPACSWAASLPRSSPTCAPGSCTPYSPPLPPAPTPPADQPAQQNRPASPRARRAGRPCCWTCGTT